MLTKLRARVELIISQYWQTNKPISIQTNFINVVLTPPPPKHPQNSLVWYLPLATASS